MLTKLSINMFNYVYSLSFLHIIIGVSAEDTTTVKSNFSSGCESIVYCSGEILDKVQMSRIYPDSKTFVDMTMAHSPGTVRSNFEKLLQQTNSHPTPDDIRPFVNQNFVEGIETENWTPTDYKSNPNLLNYIGDAAVKNFTRSIIKRWTKMSKKCSEEMRYHPERYSMIFLPKGFIIPGGRYTEMNYFDSYWIIQGLLISDMYETAKGMLDNLVYMVEKFGYVPTGNRIYYMNRTHPPLLVKSVMIYTEATDDIDWLKANIGSLAKEMEYWINNNLIVVESEETDYNLAIYTSASTGPRPESYFEDVEAASIFSTDDEKEELYDELKRAAQTVWELSSRWIFDKNGSSNANISFTVTSRVVPVDLNAILYGAFDGLSKLYEKLEMKKEQETWNIHAKSLLEGITHILYNAEDGIWYDYDLLLKQPRKTFAVSCLTPLWTRAYPYISDDDKSAVGAKAVEYLRREEIPSYLGGIPATKQKSKLLWDFPNAWAPYQSIVVEGLSDTENEEAEILAEELGRNWVVAIMRGFVNESSVYEKYDAEIPGFHGVGRISPTATGFGWTNAVILEFVASYYSSSRSSNASNVRSATCVAKGFFVRIISSMLVFSFAIEIVKAFG